MICVTLPWPPSNNRMFRTPTTGRLAGRTMLSEAGRKYRAAVATSLILAKAPRAEYHGRRLAVSIFAQPPDRRKRDLDNLPKAILDALVHADIIRDDSDIDRLLIERGEVTKDGVITVEISLA